MYSSTKMAIIAMATKSCTPSHLSTPPSLSLSSVSSFFLTSFFCYILSHLHHSLSFSPCLRISFSSPAVNCLCAVDVEQLSPLGLVLCLPVSTLPFWLGGTGVVICLTTTGLTCLMYHGLMNG